MTGKLARVLVTGSRNWTDREIVHTALDKILEDGPVVLVQGDCDTGADFFARSWARNNNVEIEHHPAAWKSQGRSAGPRRNKQMVDKGADICLAFQIGNSKGTQNCIDLCRKFGIPVVLFRPRSAS